MLIRFKNKMILGLQSMVDQANKIGGIPSHIEISTDEAKNLIEELSYVLKEVPSSLASFRFVIREQIITFDRLRNQFLKTEDLVSHWRDKSLLVSFMRIDLIIVDVTTDNEKYHG